MQISAHEKALGTAPRAFSLLATPIDFQSTTNYESCKPSAQRVGNVCNGEQSVDGPDDNQWANDNKDDN